MENTAVKKMRDSNIELLRIVAMLFIVFHHFNGWGLSFNSVDPTSINCIISSAFSATGKIGVQIFIIISGYFLINSEFKPSRFFSVYFKTWFYSVLFLIVAAIYGSHHIPSTLLNSSLFPLCGSAYWFITTYLILYLISPLLNIVIKEVHKDPKKYGPFCFIFLLFSCIIPTFFHTGYSTSALQCFICFYSIGAFIKLKTFKILNNDKLIKIGAIICFFIIMFYIIRALHSVPVGRTQKMAEFYMIVPLIISTCLFKTFLNLKIGYNKLINWVSGSTLAVYLIHDNNLVRPFLWHKLLHLDNILNSKIFVFKMILICGAIFFSCIIIDKVLSFVYKPISNYIIKTCKEKLPAHFKS